MTDITLDPAILAALPTGSKVLRVSRHGATKWSSGIKVELVACEGHQAYFVKLIEGEELVGMAEAEYECQKLLSSVIPGHAAEPVAWGYYEGDKTKSWFLTQFRGLLDTPPPLPELLPVITKLHAKRSPTGKFGFHITPFFGPPPMIVDWTDNWEEFWTREFRSGLAYAQRMRGDDPELCELAEEFIAKVVPRLLRPLQTGGRNIKPSLCHGDLWHGNIAMDKATGAPVLFDPCTFYGHHEMDFQCMRSQRYNVGPEFVKLYLEKVGASEPTVDFDDRNAMYAIRNDILTAGMASQSVHLLEVAKEDMRRLISKHPDGLVGFKGDLTRTAELETAGKGLP